MIKGGKFTTDGKELPARITVARSAFQELDCCNREAVNINMANGVGQG